MTFRRPELAPLLFIIAATLLLGGMGAWQVERLQWKNGILAQIQQAQNATALAALPRDESDITYHRVTISGSFLHDKRMYVISQPRSGQAGFSVLTLLKLKDGRTVLVNRGWSPRGQESLPKGVQKIEGVVRPLRGKRYFSPPNNAEKNLWFYEDTAEMTAGTALPYVIEQTGKFEANAYPQPSNGKISLRNDHLGYAITWFSLAFAGVIMFFLYHRQKPNNN